MGYKGSSSRLLNLQNTIPLEISNADEDRFRFSQTESSGMHCFRIHSAILLRRYLLLYKSCYTVSRKTSISITYCFIYNINLYTQIISLEMLLGIRGQLSANKLLREHLIAGAFYTKEIPIYAEVGRV